MSNFKINTIFKNEKCIVCKNKMSLKIFSSPRRANSIEKFIKTKESLIIGNHKNLVYFDLESELCYHNNYQSTEYYMARVCLNKGHIYKNKTYQCIFNNDDKVLIKLINHSPFVVCGEYLYEIENKSLFKFDNKNDLFSIATDRTEIFDENSDKIKYERIRVPNFFNLDFIKSSKSEQTLYEKIKTVILLL